MKRISRLVCLIMTVVFVFMLIPAANAASKITLKSGKAAPSTIYAGHSYNLKVAGVKVKFASSNKKVATIGATTGKLKAAAPGTVKITAKNAKSGKAVASKTFNVLQRAKSVAADSEVYLAAIGDIATLKATLTPSTSTDVIRFTSADKTIATIGATSGKITAKAEGKTTVNVYAKATKATANSNKNNKVAQVTVYIGLYLDSAYQKRTNTIHVTFKSNVSGKELKPADFEVTNLTTRAVFPVKAVANASENEADLILYSELLDVDTTYSVKYGKSTANFTVGEIPKDVDIPVQLVLSEPTLSMWTGDGSGSVFTSASVMNNYGEKLYTNPGSFSFELIQAPGSTVPEISAEKSNPLGTRIMISETPDLEEGSYLYQVNYKAKYKTVEGTEEEKTFQSTLVLNVVHIEKVPDPVTSTVTFYEKNGDSRVLLESRTLEVGSEVPKYNATKAGMTCSWTWYRGDTGEQITAPSLVPAYNISAVAQWKTKKDQYTVTFVDEDGTVLKQATYADGTSAADIVKPADPVKAADARYTYTFSGWSPAIEAVTDDVTYTATYSSTVNQYTVTFSDENGTVLSSAKYDYGTAAADIVKPADPAKAADAQYTYTFSGWSPAVAEVTGNATYTATYTGTVNQYTVTFSDENGTVLSSAKYDYGTAAADITKPADPAKAADAKYTYTFSGWDPAVADVTGNATYKAAYTGTVNQYTVTFSDENGTVLSSAKYDYGTAAADITKPADPAKAADAQYTYTFSGWDPAVAEVTGNAAYKATYTGTVNKYTVTFKDADGTVLSTAEYEYGTKAADIEQPADPTKAADARYTYKFAGWDRAVADVTQDATYTATYSSTVNKYTVTFKDEDGTVLSSVAYDYGTAAANIVIPQAPAKDADAQYTYSFKGWDHEIADVTADVTYKATYAGTVNQYTVTFKNEDGTELSSAKYDYGTAAADIAKPADLTKAPTVDKVYTFAWSPAVADVTGDATYTATFTESVRQYTVTFKDESGNDLSSVKYDYGTAASGITKPADLTKAATAQYTYKFAWSPAVADVTGDATYTAAFTPSVRQYTVTFKDESGNDLSSKKYDYGTAASDIAKPADLSKAPTTEKVYLFAWSPAVADVTQDVIYTATFTESARQYTVTFLDNDGKTELKKVSLDYNSPVTALEKEAPPLGSQKTGSAGEKYKLTGWTAPFAAVTGDASYTAVFNRAYTITVHPYSSGYGAPYTDDHPEKQYTKVLLQGETIPDLGTPAEIQGYEDKYFDGWAYVSDQGAVQKGDPMPDYDVGAYGVWKPKSSTTDNSYPPAN